MSNPADRDDRRIPDYQKGDRKEAVAWMARKLASGAAKGQRPGEVYSWFVSGDALDDPAGPYGAARRYIEWLYWTDDRTGEGLSTLGQIRRFRSDCFAAAARL